MEMADSLQAQPYTEQGRSFISLRNDEFLLMFGAILSARFCVVALSCNSLATASKVVVLAVTLEGIHLATVYLTYDMWYCSRSRFSSASTFAFFVPFRIEAGVHAYSNKS
jgi:hypothetical protein